MASDPVVQLSDAPDAEIAAYRPVSRLAIFALFCGLLAWTAMVDPLLWVVPPIGILLGGLALGQIARNAPELAGRKAALIGLMLSIFFAAAAPTHWFGYRWLLEREARQFADAWFEALRSGQPYKAHQLTQHPANRLPLDDGLRPIYRQSPYWRGQLKDYLAEQPLRTLRALAGRARARYYVTEAFAQKKGIDAVFLQYAVTFDEQRRKKTFFVSLKLQRVTLETGRADWRLVNVINSYPPQGL